jgi:hypothetical protein
MTKSFRCSSNFSRVIKSRRVGYVGHVARIGERRDAYRVPVSKSEGRDHLKDPGVNGRII